MHEQVLDYMPELSRGNSSGSLLRNSGSVLVLRILCPECFSSQGTCFRETKTGHENGPVPKRHQLILSSSHTHKHLVVRLTPGHLL